MKKLASFAMWSPAAVSQVDLNGLSVLIQRKNGLAVSERKIELGRRQRYQACGEPVLQLASQVIRFLIVNTLPLDI